MIVVHDLVSIIVPVYNAEKYLEDCVNSLIQQTYADIEIILVDDGSKDKSGMMCDTFAKCYEKVKVIHKHNGGLSDARNIGVQVSKGKYITFVDADDYVSKDYISILLEGIQKSGSQIAIGNFKKFQEGESFSIEKKTYHVEAIKREQALSKLNDSYNPENTRFIVAWGKLYLKELFDDISFPVGKWHEDEFVAHTLYHKAEGTCLVPVDLYFYRQHPESFMNISDYDHEVARTVILEALSERTLFFFHEYPELLLGAAHRLLQQSNSFYMIFSQHKEWKANEIRKKVINSYKTVYKTVFSKLSNQERIKGFVFATMPGLYAGIISLISRRKDN